MSFCGAGQNPPARIDPAVREKPPHQASAGHYPRFDRHLESVLAQLVGEGVGTRRLGCGCGWTSDGSQLVIDECVESQVYAGIMICRNA
jgi:hypothetical protein